MGTPYLVFAKAWGVSYSDVLSFRDAYKLKFNKEKMTYWHTRAARMFQGTDTADAIIAIYNNLESGGEGNAVRCHMTETFMARNVVGSYDIYPRCRFPTWEVLEARFDPKWQPGTPDILCRVSLFVIIEPEPWIAFRTVPENMRYAYLIRYNHKDAEGNPAGYKYEIKGGQRSSSTRDKLLFPMGPDDSAANG